VSWELFVAVWLFQAEFKAFVGDGISWIWTISKNRTGLRRCVRSRKSAALPSAK